MQLLSFRRLGLRAKSAQDRATGRLAEAGGLKEHVAALEAGAGRGQPVHLWRRGSAVCTRRVLGPAGACRPFIPRGPSRCQASCVLRASGRPQPVTDWQQVNRPAVHGPALEEERHSVDGKRRRPASAGLHIPVKPNRAVPSNKMSGQVSVWPDDQLCRPRDLRPGTRRCTTAGAGVPSSGSSGREGSPSKRAGDCSAGGASGEDIRTPRGGATSVLVPPVPDDLSPIRGPLTARSELSDGLRRRGDTRVRPSSSPWPRPPGRSIPRARI